jgi:hypothetical protein
MVQFDNRNNVNNCDANPVSSNPHIPVLMTRSSHIENGLRPTPEAEAQVQELNIHLDFDDLFLIPINILNYFYPIPEKYRLPLKNTIFNYCQIYKIDIARRIRLANTTYRIRRPEESGLNERQAKGQINYEDRQTALA